MAENLKAVDAFDGLEKNVDSTKKTSLEDDEKRALKALTDDDIEKAKDKEKTDKFFGNQKFELKLPNGETTEKSLRFIVNKFNTQSNSIIYEDKGNEIKIPVDNNSELAVAIQFYLILKGNDIRTNAQMSKNKNLASGIDGTIGEVTKQKIDDLHKPSSSKDKNESLNKEVSINSLDDQNYLDYFKEQKWKNLKVIDRNTGAMKFKLNDRDHQPEIKTINGKKCVTIYYGKVLPIAIDVPLELKKGNVDLNKFTQSVKDAVDASETKLNQDSNYRKLSEGIEKFDEQTITDPLIKRFATDKKLNFTCEKKDNGKVILKGVVTDKGTVPYISSEINSTSMIKDGKFDNELFNEQLYNCFHKDAAKYLNNYYIDKLNSNVVLASDSEDANELQRNIALCDEYLDAEKKLNKKGDLDSSMGTITTRKTELTDKKEYVEDKTQLDRMVTLFENAGKGKRQGEEIRAKVNVLQTFRYMSVRTETDSDGLITKIRLAPNGGNIDGFKTPEQKREYNDAVQNMARTLRTIDRTIQVEIRPLS